MARRELPNHDSVEVQGLRELWEFLTSRVIGQERAIRNIVRGFNIAGADLLPKGKPLSSFFLAGPTGVGKTELPLALADFLWMREKKVGINYPAPPIVKIDSGTFAGALSHAVSELLGAPVGYVGSKGHTEGARQPKFAQANFPPDRLMVLLFDEIEKAIGNRSGLQGGVELLAILLAILDKAEIQTRWDDFPTNFEKTIPFFTSNIGASDILQAATEGGLGFHALERQKKGVHLTEDQIRSLNENIYRMVDKAMKEEFPPEFLARMTRSVVFRFLTRGNFSQILDKELLQLSASMRAKHGIELSYAPRIKEWMLNHGLEGERGVRPLQNFVLREISDPLATYLNGSILLPNAKVVVDTPDASREGTGSKPIFIVEE